MEVRIDEPELVPNAPIRRPAPHRRGKRRPVPAADEAPNPAATDPIAVSNKIFYVTKSHHNYKIVEIFVSKLSIFPFLNCPNFPLFQFKIFKTASENRLKFLPCHRHSVNFYSTC